MKRAILLSALAFAACTDSIPDEESTGTTTQDVRTTHFIVNENGADGFISDGTNGGFLQVGSNFSQGVRTVNLTFSLTYPDPLNGTQFFLDTGSGSIPSSNFSASLTSGTLNTTTTFPIDHCLFSTISGLISCSPGAPKTFNLTWTKNNLAVFRSTGLNETTFGCQTIKNNGTFKGVSANITGTFDGHNAAGSTGTLSDNHQNSITRDVTGCT